MTDIEHAKQLLTGEGYTCVICRGDDIHTSEKRGVAPLIELLDSNIDIRGYSAADEYPRRFRLSKRYFRQPDKFFRTL